MNDVSVFIIAKNEGRHLARCLTPLRGWVREVIVVDDFSTDDTTAVARSFGATVIQHAFEDFGKQKQFALAQAKTEWVLSLDADEVLTDALVQEIQSVLAHPTADGYLIQRQTFFLGHRLAHVGHRDQVLRLFRRSKGRFSQKPVHEFVEISGATALLSAPLEHYSFDSIEDCMDKNYRYAYLIATERYAAGRRFRLIDMFRPVWELFARLILKGGWMDGVPGLAFATIVSHAAWLRYIWLWEMEERQRSAQRS